MMLLGLAFSVPTTALLAYPPVAVFPALLLTLGCFNLLLSDAFLMLVSLRTVLA